MFRIFVLLTVLCLCVCPAGADDPHRPQDLYFGEALYYALQGRWFDAVGRLDAELMQYHGLDEPHKDSLHYHIDHAEFAVGDFELAYRMHQRAGRAITRVIEGNVAETVRNEAVFRLARIYFQKDQPHDALYAVERIHGAVAPDLRSDLAFLRAQILMVNDRNREAANILQELVDAKSLAGFSGYNLGIALIRDDREPEGRQYLNRIGLMNADQLYSMAIKDKSNLVLGYKMLREENYLEAAQILDRVRLKGPFSSRALLGSGWAYAFQERFERALVPWSILATRDVTDAAVQEALLAVAYAYGKLNVNSKAALLYADALEKFGNEIDKLDRSIKSIREGHFLKALTREEFKQDADWVVKLRRLPQAPETYYLLELMASHDFQESLKNYLDLEELRKKLETWSGDLDAFEEIIALRRAYYEPLLPDIDKAFRQLDSRMRLRLAQRNRIQQRLKTMLVAPRPDYLATAQERIIGGRIKQLQARSVQGDVPAFADIHDRIGRLQGVLTWNIYTEYDRRLTEAHQHLHDLNHEIEILQKQYDAFVRTRQAASQSYQGYDQEIRRGRIQIQAARQKVDKLMARQGHMLETMAVNELTRRLERLTDFQIKARFAMADSYDRATREQIREKVGP